MEIMQVLQQNPMEVAAMGGALLTVGGIIVKLTPTKTDDAWWAALMKALGRRK